MVAKAVASSVKTPGFFLTIDLLGGVSGPGAAVNRALIIAPKNTADGDITPDTEVRQIFGPDDAAISHGVDGQGHLTAKGLFKKYPLASVDIVAPAVGAGAAASITHVFTTAPTESSVVTIDVKGIYVDVPWNPGESPTVARDRAVSLVNQKSGQGLPVIASAGAGAGDLDLDARSAGPWGNDITTGMAFTVGGTGGVIAAGGTALAGGTIEPDFTNVLALVNTEQYTIIVGGLSNADASDATSSSNADRMRVHIEGLDSGLDALLQVGLVGHTGSIANVKAGAINRNSPVFEYIYGQAFQSLPCELAGEEAGDTLAGLAQRANYNRIGNEYLTLVGPKNIAADKLTGPEVEDLLNNGVSVVGLARRTNRPFLVKPITTHSLFSGNPDFRAHHMSDTYGAQFVGDDIRTAMPQEFPNASITPDLPPGDNDLPPGVVEEKDARAWVHSRMHLHADNGIVQRARLEETIASGELIVEIDSTDESQLNVFVPLKIIKPLAKIGAVVSKE